MSNYVGARGGKGLMLASARYVRLARRIKISKTPNRHISFRLVGKLR